MFHDVKWNGTEVYNQQLSHGGTLLLVEGDFTKVGGGSLILNSAGNAGLYSRSRGHGADDMLLTSAGLWIASDNFGGKTSCGGVSGYAGICFRHTAKPIEVTLIAAWRGGLSPRHARPFHVSTVLRQQRITCAKNGADKTGQTTRSCVIQIPECRSTSCPAARRYGRLFAGAIGHRDQFRPAFPPSRYPSEPPVVALAAR